MKLSACKHFVIDLIYTQHDTAVNED